MRYADALYFLRAVILIPWKQNSFAFEIQNYTIRGLKASLLSWCCASLDFQKRSKFLRLVQALESQKHIHKRDIERFLGLAMWVTQLFQGMRPLLQYFYADLFLPLPLFPVLTQGLGQV